MCRVFKIVRSSYLSWTSRDTIERDQHAQHDAQRVRDVFFALKQNGGTRSIKAQLKRIYDPYVSGFITPARFEA